MNLKRRILFIDNEDSFVYNLVDAYASMGHDVDVYRSDWPVDEAQRYLDEARPDLLVLSPGPGTPGEATLSMKMLELVPAELAVFGVCLGHQCIVEHFGGRVEATGCPAHGKASVVRHNGDELWQGIDRAFSVGRYHSLAATRLPDELEATAWAQDMVMAVRHRHRPVFGVQFHPESVLTPVGHRLLANVSDGIKATAVSVKRSKQGSG